MTSSYCVGQHNEAITTFTYECHFHSVLTSVVSYHLFLSSQQSCERQRPSAINLILYIRKQAQRVVPWLMTVLGLESWAPEQSNKSDIIALQISEDDCRPT